MEKDPDQSEFKFWDLKEVEKLLDDMLQDILKEIDEAEKKN